jgi:hypothetical protein
MDIAVSWHSPPGPVIGLVLYGVLREFGGWRYTPVVFVAVFLPGIGFLIVWARNSGEE